MSVAGKCSIRHAVQVGITLALLTGVFLTLMHWHEESASQRCEICFVRHLPSVYVPFAAWFAVPIRVEWRPPIEKPVTLRAAWFRLNTSRAPPLTASI